MAFIFIIILQGQTQAGEPPVRRRTFSNWRPPLNLCHQPIHISQFIHGLPSPILLLPIKAGRQPYRKSLHEVFIRMILGIIAVQMTHIILAVGAEFIRIGIFRRRRAEDLLPFPAFVEAVRITDGMAGLKWQEQYRGWKAMDKLRYVDRLMAEIQGRPPVRKSATAYWRLPRLRPPVE